MSNSPIKILWVDDDINTRDALEIFDWFGEEYHLSLAQSIETAIMKLEKQVFDIILTDLMFFRNFDHDGRDGIDFINKIRNGEITGKCKELHSIPAILITATSFKILELRHDFITSKITKVIVKPFDPFDLPRLINEILDIPFRDPFE